MDAGADAGWTAAIARHRALNRDRILEAAIRLIADEGLAHVTMSLLAERAGVSRATLYHYFPDLDHVLVAWVERQVDRFISDLARKVEGEADPVRRLQVIILDLATYFAGPDHRMSLEQLGSQALAPATARAVADRMSPLMELVAGCLRSGQAAGLFRPDFDSEIHAELILGLLGAIRPHLVSRRYSSSRAAEAVTHLVLRGIAVEP